MVILLPCSTFVQSPLCLFSSSRPQHRQLPALLSSSAGRPPHSLVSLLLGTYFTPIMSVIHSACQYLLFLVPVVFFQACWGGYTFFQTSCNACKLHWCRDHHRNRSCGRGPFHSVSRVLGNYSLPYVLCCGLTSPCLLDMMSTKMNGMWMGSGGAVFCRCASQCRDIVLLLLFPQTKCCLILLQMRPLPLCRRLLSTLREKSILL